MLYIVIVFGLTIVWQLGSILSAMRDQQTLKEELQKLMNELQWHKDYTFAHRLMEQLESHKKDIKDEIESYKKDIMDELQWYKDSSFAHDLREWLKEIPKDIVNDIVPELREIVQELQRDR